MEINQDVLNLSMLSYKKRKEAHALALDELIGKKKTFDDFKVDQVSEYPKWLIYTLLFISMVLFLATFFPSASRIFMGGSEVFCEGDYFQNENVCRVAGISLVAMAETSVFLFSIISVVLVNKDRFTYYLTRIAVWLGVIMALSGNIYVTHEGLMTAKNEAIFVFKLLETFLPPLMTLFLAVVIERWIVSAIENNRDTKEKYNTYVLEQREKELHPEEHPQWNRFYGRLIWNSLIELWLSQAQDDNERFLVERLINNLSKAEKTYLVRRELDVDRFEIDLDKKTLIEKELSKYQAEKTEDGFWHISDPESGFATVVEYKQKKKALAEFEKMLAQN